MTDSRTFTVIIVALLAGILISSTIAAYYLYQYNEAQNNANLYLGELKQASSATVQTATTTVVSGGVTNTVTSTATGTRGFVATINILLDFGNGTQRWYNDTAVQAGWNAYLATVVVTGGNLNDTWYPQYGEHLVNGIDGLQNSRSGSWFLWTYGSASRWEVAQSGADQLPATNGSVFAWSYCGITASYAPTCTSP